MTNFPLVIVMGVCGSGKSTIGAGLAEQLGVHFIEGDDLHLPNSVDKMAAGIPLTDEDRWPWLREIADALMAQKRAGHGAVASCSSLKRVYREWLSSILGSGLRFVFLDGPRDLLAARVADRSGHFVTATLLQSQLAALEPPSREEALILDIARSPSELIAAASAWLNGGPETSEGLL